MSVDKIFVLGVNHKTAPVEIRERLAFSSDPGTPFREIRVIPGCEEFCFLSTCNRVEVIFVSSLGEETERRIRNFLFAGRMSYEEAGRYVYLHRGEAALSHLFRVGAGLDSMIVGEPQILGQLKQAYRNATDQQCTGLILNRLLHKAFSVAKRIRTETGIGSSAVSISYAAVELAKKIFGSLSHKKVLLVGAGEMAELAAQHLANQGIDEVIVANRTFERAVKMARCFNGKAVAFEEMVEQLAVVDIMISSTGAPGLILLKDQVKPIMRQRRNRPLFLIDIAVPRDLDPGLNDLENIYLYGIDDLQNVVEINRAERDKEAVRAERIVTEETLKFMLWLGSIEVSPTIVALRQKADAVRAAELARTFSQLPHLSDKERKALDMLTSSIVNKLLHNPIIFLKKEGKDETAEDKRARIDVFHRLFGLDSNGNGPDQED
ncbi:MAG: glutamyl-tRNA reductase [Deltaproteobacteria bacterium RIFOXYD12_FULL_57_12]|nr:MAG: glutamyl-tRNA reductase [Deltaproteobacteria bacterium RIFOXYD12_FULL_57_12]